MKFSRKPVIVDAFRFGIDKTPEWFIDAVSITDHPTPVVTWNVGENCIIITESIMTHARHGDWIIREDDGSLSVRCHADFIEEYEPVEEN